MGNHNAKFDYKGMETVGVTCTYYTNETPSKHLNGENIPLNEKILMKLHKIGGAHLQCVKNNYINYELQITQTRHTKSVADGLTE